MRKHLFSSGEELYKKNVKALAEGEYTADALFYDTLDTTAPVLTSGKLDGKPVQLRFTIAEPEQGELQFKANIHILMQSDLIQAEWSGYEIESGT